MSGKSFSYIILVSLFKSGHLTTDILIFKALKNDTFVKSPVLHTSLRI